MKHVPQRLSAELSLLAERAGAMPIRLGELIEVLQVRGGHAVLLFLALPFVSPLPMPGFSLVFGVLIAVLGARMACSRGAWVPHRWRDRELTPRVLPGLLRGTSRFLARVESLLKPRCLYPGFSTSFQRITGVLVAISGFLLLLPLPVPFSNAFPALTIVLLAAAGLERDGAVFALGCLQFLLCLAFFGAIAFGGTALWQNFTG